MKPLSRQLHLQAELPPSLQETLPAPTSTDILPSQANITRKVRSGQHFYTVVLPRQTISQEPELPDIVKVSSSSSSYDSSEHHRKLTPALSHLFVQKRDMLLYLYYINTYTLYLIYYYFLETLIIIARENIIVITRSINKTAFFSNVMNCLFWCQIFNNKLTFRDLVFYIVFFISRVGINYICRNIATLRS